MTRLPDSRPGRRLRSTLAAIASEIWSSPPVPAQHAATVAFDEPSALRHRVDASRRLHAAVARAAATCLWDAGAELAAPAAAFYLYPGFLPHASELVDRWAIRSDVALARCLLEEHGVAVLPGSAFGDRPGRLRLRVATSLLYGWRRACSTARRKRSDSLRSRPITRRDSPGSDATSIASGPRSARWSARSLPGAAPVPDGPG